jgi:MraZ protein
VGARPGDGADEAGETRVFLGEFQHTVDAKGRVSLPRKHRDEIGSRIVVTKGLEKCLYVYPAEGYREFLDELLATSTFDRNSRAVRRFFVAGASEVEIDSAGRVGLTPVLRDFAGLTRDVVVAGVADHIEIWDAAAWAAYQQENASTIEDAAEELSRSGIL